MDFLGLIDSRPLVVGDGAMGTRLFERGLGPGECGELWNLDRPDDVEDVLRSYVEAGADFVLTNTFGASGLALGRHGVRERLAEVNRAAVAVARRAAGGRALVVGDLGPGGSLLEPYGDVTEAQVRASFEPQVEALAAAGVDALICETFDSSAELRIVLEVVRRRTDLPAIACMKFTPERSGRFRTIMGEGPDALVETCRDCGCAVVGTNCGQGSETMSRLVAELAGLSDLPIMVEPNAGMPRLVGGRTVYPEDAETFAGRLPGLYQAGARIIGGCCGTTPDHIRAIRRFADSL
jgi:5-methyltetrahydrofolate--homocysteine methyltransferase